MVPILCYISNFITTVYAPSLFIALSGKLECMNLYTMTLFQHHLLALGITSATTLGFGLFVLVKNPRRPLNRSMAFFLFSLSWWSAWECAALQMPTRVLALQLIRIEYIGVVFIPTLTCTTVTYLLGFTSQARRRFLLPLYVFSGVSLFFSTIFPTKEFLTVSPGPVAYLPVWGWAGPYYWIFLTLWFGVGLLGHLLVFLRWRRSEGVERTRLALFLGGTLFAYLGGTPEFALKYGVRLGWLNPFGLYAFPVYVGLLTYSVLRHRFLDIRVVIRRSLVYSLLVTALTTGYFGLLYGIERLLQDTFGYRSMWVSLTAFALMALAFQPLKVGIQRLVDWLIYRAPQEELARRLEHLQETAAEAEKFKAVSTLAAGMAHEIKNPLTAIKAFAESIPEKQHDPAFLEKLHQVLTTESTRVQRIVQDLLDFAKPKEPQLKPIDPEVLLHSTLNFLSADLSKRSIQWSTDCRNEGAILKADPDQLRQVLINLIQNAADAMPEGGRLSISTRCADGCLELAVSDTGCGIPKELLPKIFDPFVTTKTNGTGLGLAMVHSIIRAHHGTLRAESPTGRGATFTVRLPL